MPILDQGGLGVGALPNIVYLPNQAGVNGNWVSDVSPGTDDAAAIATAMALVGKHGGELDYGGLKCAVASRLALASHCTHAHGEWHLLAASNCTLFTVPNLPSNTTDYVIKNRGIGLRDMVLDGNWRNQTDHDELITDLNIMSIGILFNCSDSVVRDCSFVRPGTFGLILSTGTNCLTSNNTYTWGTNVGDSPPAGTTGFMTYSRIEGVFDVETRNVGSLDDCICVNEEHDQTIFPLAGYGDVASLYLINTHISGNAKGIRLMGGISVADPYDFNVTIIHPDGTCTNDYSLIAMKLTKGLIRIVDWCVVGLAPPTVVTDGGTATIEYSITLPPTIVSAATVSGSVGGSCDYAGVAIPRGDKTWSATGLPEGVSINTSTGVISGTPTTEGVYNATITATNAFGSGNRALTVTVTAENAVTLLASYEFAGNFNDSTGSANLSVVPLVEDASPTIADGVATFDGNSYLSGNASNLPSGTNDRTIVAEVKPSLVGIGSGGSIAVYGESAPSKVVVLGIRSIGIDNKWSASPGYVRADGTDVDYEEWVKVVLTIRTLSGVTVWKLFVDGTLVATRSIETNTTDGGFLNIGGDDPETGYGSPFFGDMRYVRFYSGAMSDEDVAAL
jgi:hypothetical protein